MCAEIGVASWKSSMESLAMTSGYINSTGQWTIPSSSTVGLGRGACSDEQRPRAVAPSPPLVRAHPLPITWCWSQRRTEAFPASIPWR